MGAPAALESDLRKLRDHKAAAEREAADLHEKATAKVAEIKEAGADPTEGEAFTAISDAFKASDVKRQEAFEAQVKIEKILAMSPDVTPSGTGGAIVTVSDGRGGRRAMTIAMAKRFMEHPAYTAARDSGVLKSTAAIGNFGHIELATRDETERFLAIAGDGRHGDLAPEDQRLGDPVPIPQRRIRIFDLITQMTTDTDLVEWAKEVTPTGNDITGVAAVRNAAAETAYGTAAPRSTYQFERQTTTVRRLPTETVATKGNLADASQLAGLLRTRISDSVLLRAEGQVLAGNGTGENLLGITSTVGIGALSRDDVGAERRVEALHRGITNIRVNLENDPSAIGLHPTTWEQIAFEKDANGQYLLASDIRQAVQPAVWGFPVVISSLFTAGTAVVGRWTAAEWYLREGLSVNAFDQHSDFASKGLVLLLAQLRAAFVLPQPKAFCTVDTL